MATNGRPEAPRILQLNLTPLVTLPWTNRGLAELLKNLKWAPVFPITCHQQRGIARKTRKMRAKQLNHHTNYLQKFPLLGFAQKQLEARSLPLFGCKCPIDVGIHHPNSRATPKCGGPSPQLKGPRRSVGVHHPNFEGPHQRVGPSPQHEGPHQSRSPSSQLKGPHQSVGVHHPNSRGHTKVWGSINPIQGATLKCGGPSPELKGPHQSVGIHHPNMRSHTKAAVHHPNSRGHTKAWESITPTQGATPKCGGPSPQLKGPHQSGRNPSPQFKGPHQTVAVHHSNSRTHAGVWGSITPTRGATPKRSQSITPTQGATPKCGGPSPQLKGPHRSVGVHHPNSRGHTKVWGSINPIQGATLKYGGPSPKLKGPCRSVGVHHPNSRGHTKAVAIHHPNSRGHTKLWRSITPTQGKGKGKLLGRPPNSSVSVIPTCPSQHPFRLAGSPTP